MVSEVSDVISPQPSIYLGMPLSARESMVWCVEMGVGEEAEAVPQEQMKQNEKERGERSNELKMDGASAKVGYQGSI